MATGVNIPPAPWESEQSDTPPSTSTFNPEGSEYDYDLAIESGARPDETGHWPSLDPRTGRLLKGFTHPTITKTLQSEFDLGNEIVRREDGFYYSQPKVSEEQRATEEKGKQKLIERYMAGEIPEDTLPYVEELINRGELVIPKTEIPPPPWEEAGPIPEDAISTTKGFQPEEEEIYEDPTIAERYNKVVNKTVERFANIAEFGDDNPAMKLFLPSVVVGQTAGVLNDVTAEAIAELTPNKVKQWATEKIQDAVGSPTIAGFMLDLIGKGEKKWEEFKKADPNLATLIESQVNVAMLLTYGKGGPKVVKKVAEETLDVASDTARFALRAKPAKEIRPIMEKAIRPNLAKFNPTAKEKYFQKAAAGAEDIVANKDNIKIINKFNETVTGHIPESVDEYAQAIQQLEKQIFKEYDAMTKGAGGTIEVEPVTRLLKIFAENDAIKAHGGTIGRYAKKTAKELEELGSITPMEAQRRIELLNTSLRTHYASPSAVTQGKAMVDSIVVDSYRKLLYRHMERLTGKEYESLRQRYSALRAVQDDVNRAANRAANAPQHDFLDIGTDIFASHQAVAALTRGDMPLLLAAGAAKASRQFAKHLQNSDRLIKKMFKGVEKSYSRKQKFKPKSKTGKAIQKSGEETKDAFPFLF